MFWGLVLEPGKRYAQTVDKPFHISMASLDVANSENELVSVNVNFQNAEFILCNLQKHKVFQTQLDLNFMAGDKIAFYTSGKGRVHLTGYLIDEDGDVFAAEEEESEEEIVNDASHQRSVAQSNKQEKRKSAGHTPARPIKKSKVESEDDDQEDDDSDSDILGMGDSASSDDEIEMESGEEEEDEGEEEDEESDESDDATPQKRQLQGKKEKQQSAQKQQLAKQANTPIEMKKKDKTPGGSTPNTLNIQANGTPETQSGKKNKKKGGETPGEGKGGQTPKTTPTGSPGQTLQKKILEGGVAVEDTQIGAGQVAKPGRFVTVYYTGRLKQNNKKFDETVQGPGFKFRLGKGEVIKGWDIGVTGMKVGGKRKLTIPAHMAYGTKGSPPVIPPNSTLVFEVELRNVN